MFPIDGGQLLDLARLPRLRMPSEDASDLLVIEFFASSAVALIFLLTMRIGSKSEP
jgi:hypothetical protein